MRIADRIGRLERTLGARAHVGVILTSAGDDVATLIAAAVKAGRVAANASLLVLPHDVPAAQWELDAVASARAYRAAHPTPARTLAAPVPTAPEGCETTPSSGLARAMIVETVGNISNNIKFFTTHAAAEIACTAMATAAATGARYEVVGLASPPRRRDRHNNRMTRG